MSLSTSSSSPAIPRHFRGNGIGNQFSNHYRPQRKNHPRAAASSSSSVCAATPLSSSPSLTAPSTTLSSSRRRISRSRSHSQSRSLHRGSGNVSGNVRDQEDEATAEDGKPSRNAYMGNSRSRSHSRSRLAAAEPSSSSSSSSHASTTTTTTATATRSNHRSHHQKKYQPAFEGAKFDTSGYCLKHPMMRLCQPTTTAAAENPSTTAAATTTTSTVKYQILRKTCPLCGEHALRNERKMRNERNRNAPHGYYRRSDDGPEDRARELLTAGRGDKSASKEEEERRDSIASRSTSLSSSSSFFGSGRRSGSGSGRRSSRRESASRVQDGPDNDNDNDNGDAANSDYGNLVSRLSVCSTASAHGRRATCSSSASASSTTTTRRRSRSSSVRSNSSSHSHSQSKSTLRESEMHRDRERDSHRTRSRSDDDDRLSITQRHGLDPPSSSDVTSSSSSVPSSSSSSSLLPLALVPSNHGIACTRHDGSHESASQYVRRRNDGHTTIAAPPPSKEDLDNGGCEVGNANRIFRYHPNESNDADKPGTTMRRLHTTEALMNHHYHHHHHHQRDRRGRIKNDQTSASIRNDDIDATRPGSNGGNHSCIPRSKSTWHVDSDFNDHRSNTVSTTNRRNTNTHDNNDNNDEGTDVPNHPVDNNDTSTIQTSKTHHLSQQSRSSSVTRTIRSKLEERIQSRRQRRRATVSSFHRSLYGGEAESVDDADGCRIRVRAAASVRGSENGDADNVTVSTRSTAKSLFASSGGRDLSFRVLSTRRRLDRGSGPRWPNDDDAKEDDRDRDRDLPQGPDRPVKSPHQESKRGRSFLRHFGNGGSHGSGGNHDNGNGAESTHRENSLVSQRPYRAKPDTTAAPTPSTSSSTLSLSTPSLATASDSSSSERNALPDARNRNHHPASRSYSTQPHRRRSLSRNARRVLETTSAMDGNKDVEPSLSLKFEVPFHPVTGMCHYHPSVCMAVRDAGNERWNGEEMEKDGGWRVVREVCPKCRRGG